MVGGWIGSVPDSLALVARRGRWWRFSWRIGPDMDDGSIKRIREMQRRQRSRYYLGRGRRAREAGQFARGALDARQAVALNPTDPWTLALLGQCLHQQATPDLAGARQALERACALDPGNGYFVRLLVDVLDALGDEPARRELLTWAWWHGAPVERWLPDGPPLPRDGNLDQTGGTETEPTPASAELVRPAVSDEPTSARHDLREPAHV